MQTNMKIVSLEPANFELSKLYHKNVQSLNRLAQLNFNTQAIISGVKSSEIVGNPILMIFFKIQEINEYKQTFNDKD